MSTPTVALYYSDDYLREMEAALLEAGAGDIVLDRTVFYPRGGNQDSDKGILALANNPDDKLTVAEVTKGDDGIIHHHVAEEIGAGWQPGATVRGRLNWDRRLLLSQLHTAQHMISRWFIDHEANNTTRVDITEAGCTIEFERPVSRDNALASVAEVNAIVRSGRPVRRLDTGGYIEIVVEDYDRQPCGGTHVRDVADIDRVALVRHKQNRMEIVAGAVAYEAERQIAAGVVGLLGTLETDVAGFAARVDRLYTDWRNTRTELAALREEVARHRIAAANPTPGVPVALDLPMVEAKMLPKLLKPAQGPGRIFLCLCANRTLVVVSGAPDQPANALADKLKARWSLSGGGSPAVAMCGPLPEDSSLEQALAELG